MCAPACISSVIASEIRSVAMMFAPSPTAPSRATAASAFRRASRDAASSSAIAARVAGSSLKPCQSQVRKEVSGKSNGTKM